MLTKSVKSLIFASGVSLMLAGTAFAGQSQFPYDVQFDVDECDRICYAGHPGDTVIYKDGFAITPESTFRILPKDSDEQNASNPGEISVAISLIYENDNHSGSHKETIKQYELGDISYDEDYRIISDNAAESLEDRDKLYSNSLSGVEMTLYSKGKDVRKKTYYLYICSDDDFDGYLSNKPDIPPKHNGDEGDTYSIDDSPYTAQ